MHAVAASLLTLAGLGGLFIALLRMRGGNPPMLLAYIHGVLAVAGLIALVISLFQNTHVFAIVALALAVVGAPFGLIMFLQHRRQVLFSLGVLVAHASMELLAIVFSWLAFLTP